jgi:hypothetical protein
MWLDMSLDEGYLNKEKHKDLSGRYERIGAMLAALWRKWKSLPGGKA